MNAEPRDDTGEGMAMSMIFVAAVLGVTGAVALLALVGTWWVLGAMLVLHLVMTAVVTSTIARVMRGRPYARSLPPAPRHAPPRAA